MSPETLSIREQVALMASAREVACTAGTLSHQILFCPDQVKMTIMLRDKRMPVLGQWAMNQMRCADCCVVDCLEPFLPGSHTAGVHYYTPTPFWSQYVQERFGEQFPIQRTGQAIVEHIRHWVGVLDESAEQDLARVPAWTVADFAEHMSRYVLGSSLDPAAVARLRRHFGTVGE